MAFYRMYFQDQNGCEYRVGFQPRSDQYQPSFERRDNNGNWQPIDRSTDSGGPKNTAARELRGILPYPIQFPQSHTQNEIMELIHQAVYNLNRAVNESVNYRGAHQ